LRGGRFRIPKRTFDCRIVAPFFKGRNAMSTVSLFEDSAGRLAAQADAVGRLAQDAGAFAAAFAAFESRDPDAFRWVLERVEILPRCELICEWLQIKLCVLRCVEVCGPPVEVERPPSLLQFAQAVVRLAEDEKRLRRAVDAVSCGDAEAFHAVLAELKLQAFCHLLCRWVCSSLWRRFCEIVCIPHIGPVPDPVGDLRAAARVMARVIENQKAFETIAKVAETLDCERTRTAIGEAGFHGECEIICWVFCTWRCAWICRELCPRPEAVLTGVHAIEEARAFALAARQLAGHPRVLFDLVTAVQGRNADLYGEIVDRFRLHPYCLQLCGWVCSVTCSEFCICICPNPVLQPWFTTVGYFGIYSDIDGTTGKTNKALPFPSLGSGGGPNFAFFGDLQLGGFCPATSPVFSGVAMKYRFLIDTGAGPQPITGGLVSPVLAGTRLVNWPQNLAGLAGPALVSTFQDVQVVAKPAPPDPTPPATGAAWFAPSTHYIPVDDNGWVEVDPNAVGGGFQTLIGFHTDNALAVPAHNPNPLPAGVAVPAGSAFTGADLSITFQATRITTMPPGTTPDYTNALAKIRINNATETNALDFAEFVTGCCTPIDATLSVQFTVDHEEMSAGGWSLAISSCSPSAPGDITPAVSGPGVTLSARGGFGTIVENTATWGNCSYTVTLSTRPGLTTGLVDRGSWPNSLTFAICGH
jgi:hypothetical protein